MEFEWLNQQHTSGRIENTLLTTLPSASNDGVDVAKTWVRWRNSSADSAFASGRIGIVMEIIDRLVQLKLLENGLADETKEFFQLLADLGNGAFSHDSYELDNGLENGYQVIFHLAEIEPLLFEENFMDLCTGLKFAPNDRKARCDISKNNFRSLTIDAALASLKAIKKLESAVNEANFVLDGKRTTNDVDPAIVRELLLAKYSDDAAGLVTSLHESLKLTCRPGGNSGAIAAKFVKGLVVRMNSEVKKLRLK